MSFIGKLHEISLYGLITNIICLCTGKISFSKLYEAAFHVNDFEMFFQSYLFWTGFINQMNPFSKPDIKYINQAYEVLAGFGKEELFNKQIDQLSSGERQIVMIVRVLLQNPEIVIVDEPTANLDVKNQIVVLNQIKNLARQGYTVIVTTHNPGHAFSMGV